MGNQNNSLVAFGGSVNLTKESQATLAETSLHR